eukprot:1161267-Pelagomonas_calceolata.AAC.5
MSAKRKLANYKLSANTVLGRKAVSSLRSSRTEVLGGEPVRLSFALAPSSSQTCCVSASSQPLRAVRKGFRSSYGLTNGKEALHALQKAGTAAN